MDELEPGVWRVLTTRPCPAAENVAIDQALLVAKSRRQSPNTLHFLQYSPAAALVGHHQSVEEEIRVDYCRSHGIDIGRRITGGGAIFFDESQLGWEIIVAKDDPRIPRQIEAIYELMCQGAVRGLRRLGIPAEFRPRNDIEVRGRKISGTGGTDLGRGLLFQGTLLMDFDPEVMLRALRIPVEKLKDKEIASVRERVTCVREELGRLPGKDEVLAALTAGFAEVFGVTFRPGDLLPAEQDLIREQLPIMSSPEYVYGLRAGEHARTELRSIYKAPGGLLRATVVADRERRQIKSILITGDFFAFPKRAIFDLEPLLKDAPIAPEAVAGIIDRYWAQARPVIPGITPEDLRRSIVEALVKVDYPALGVPAEEVNAVFTVVRPLAEMPAPTVLLLPYCAKQPDCEYRYEQGCAECGRCTVGDGYRLAREHNLQPVTIQNYEELEATLAAIRDGGAPAFVGCCCEAFLAKHRDDFERIGMPGVLIDLANTTCYDLGQEDVAHRGQFDRLTNMKLDVLEKILERLCKGAPA